jgi:hypothetical protein
LPGASSAETLIEFDSEGCCHLHDGPNLAPQTVRRLSCDAGIVRIVEDAQGQALDVGRKTRTIPPALKRALSSRDKGCRFAGCGTHVCAETNVDQMAAEVL